MATLKFYDANEDGTFNVKDINQILQQHPNLPVDKQQEFQSIAMGLVGQGGMVTPGADIPGAQSIQYDDPMSSSMSDTEIEAGQLGAGATGTVMDQGVGGTSGFGFDSTGGGFNPTDREEVGNYLRDTLGFDENLVSKIQGNINLYDPTKEQQLQTQYGFDVGALGQQQRGSILEGMAGAGQQAFAGRGLVSGRRRAGYRQGISEAQRQFETGLAQKQFGLTSNILEAQKDYDFVGELNKLKELGQIDDAEFQSATDAIRYEEELGKQGNVSMGYPTQQEYLDSQDIRSQFSDNQTISATASKAGKLINVTELPTDHFKGYGLDSSFEPIYKGAENEEKTYTVFPTLVGGNLEAGKYLPSVKDEYKITAKWEGPSGQGNWNINKTKV
tara:strand:+ start:1608 stop:2768 length:1161 start_codon:yes stop_codon:yes gene_type:complete